jgi:hypothetical protein
VRQMRRLPIPPLAAVSEFLSHTGRSPSLVNQSLSLPGTFPARDRKVVPLQRAKAPPLAQTPDWAGWHLPLPYVSRTNLDAAVTNLDAKALRPKLHRFDFALSDQLATEFST